MDSDARLRALMALHRYYAHAEVMRYEWHQYVQMAGAPPAHA